MPFLFGSWLALLMIDGKGELEKFIMDDQGRFVTLRKASRIWAIGAVHGNAGDLCALHDQIANKLCAGDKLVYLGNYIGYGQEILPTLQEILRFRRWFLSIPPLTTLQDIVYLRGRQEEMWQKLRQLQFAPNPVEILDWVKSRGVAQTLEAFGLSVDEGIKNAEEGTLALTYWTTKLKDAGRSVAGHDQFFSSLKHAAFNEGGSILMVSSGLDVTKSLSRQVDSLWWSGKSFEFIDGPYGGFKCLVRGYDPLHQGYKSTDGMHSLDAGNPENGKPIAVCLSGDGQIEDLIITQ